MKQPYIEDWRNLKRVLCFMNHTIDDKRITGTNNLHKIQYYDGSSHTVHMNMRGHTGGVSTFGIGVLTANSSKKKFNLIN